MHLTEALAGMRGPALFDRDPLVAYIIQKVLCLCSGTCSPSLAENWGVLRPLARAATAEHGDGTMRSNAYSLRNEAREERKRQELATGLLSESFPDVSSIVVTMNYGRGSRSAVLRTLITTPGATLFSGSAA